MMRLYLHLRPQHLRYLIVTGVMTLFALIFVAIYQVGTAGTPRAMPAYITFLREIPSYYGWVFLSPLVFWIGRRFRPGPGQWLRNTSVLVLAGLLIIGVHYLVLAVFEGYFGPNPNYEMMGAQGIRGVYHLLFINTAHYAAMIYVALLGIGYAFDYYEQYTVRDLEASGLRAQTAELEAQLSKARLDAVKAQLQPHFLFNTLNSVSALMDQDVPAARRMMEQLSDLLRLTLDDRNVQEVLLAREFSILEKYLAIQQIRFQDFLNVHIEAEPGTEWALVPPFLLQPLVENAFKHGIASDDRFSLIDIRAYRDGPQLVLEVRDNGPGLKHPLRREGVGLSSIRERLAHLYGDDARLELVSREGGGLVARVRLPFYRRIRSTPLQRPHAEDFLPHRG